jgi:hypothetical protein
MGRRFGDSYRHHGEDSLGKQGEADVWTCPISYNSDTSVLLTAGALPFRERADYSRFPSDPTELAESCRTDFCGCAATSRAAALPSSSSAYSVKRLAVTLSVMP